MSMNRGPSVSLYNEYSTYSKLNFDELGRIYTYLHAEREKYLDSSPSLFSFRIPVYKELTEEDIELEAKYNEMHFVCLALEDAAEQVEKKMIELKGEKAFEKFWEEQDDSDPHIGCFAYPMCHETPVGCCLVMGDAVEPIGHR